MKTIYILILSLLSNVLLHSQVKLTNSDDQTIDSSLAFEVDNSTDQGFMIPKTNITTSIFDSTNPIEDPADGLIIYNKGENSNFAKGFYIWYSGRWNLLADRNNMVNDLAIKSNVLNSEVLDSDPLSFVVLDFLDVPLFSNNIGGASYLNRGNHAIHLPPGLYTIKIEVDYLANNLTTEEIRNGVNLMVFKGEIINPESLVVLSDAVLSNSTLNNNTKKSLMSFDFIVDLISEQDLVLKLSNFGGSSYYGPITIQQYKVHVQTIK